VNWKLLLATELPNLPRPFTGYDHDNGAYTDVYVTASGTPLAEEWIVLLEASKTYQYQEEVTVLNYFDTLEEAGKQLTERALADCRGEEGKVVVQSINGNAVTRYRDEETGAQREVSHW
jgi:hypothetical protein